MTLSLLRSVLTCFSTNCLQLSCCLPFQKTSISDRALWLGSSGRSPSHLGLRKPVRKPAFGHLPSLKLIWQWKKPTIWRCILMYLLLNSCEKNSASHFFVFLEENNYRNMLTSYNLKPPMPMPMHAKGSSPQGEITLPVIFISYSYSRVQVPP